MNILIFIFTVIADIIIMIITTEKLENNSINNLLSMQINAQPTLIILQREPGNLKCEISPNNAKDYKKEASILVST